MGTTREQVLIEAGQDAARGEGSWADARAAYLWVLARHPDDPEALYGLARVDAWDGCLALAEASYRRILAKHPRDADVRAGLADVLVWVGRFDDAEKLVDEGLVLDPRSAPLVVRKARLAYFQGDASAAEALGERALALAPEDGDVKAARARLFRNEVRALARLDHYPKGYADVATLAAQGMHRFGRFELTGGLQALRRAGATGQTAVVDLRVPVGFAYHPGLGTTVGAEVAPSFPADAVPRFAVRAFGLLPVTSRLSAFASYSFWAFDAGSTVHILNPSVGVTLPWQVHVDARAFLSAVRLPGPAGSPADVQFAGAYGGAVSVPVKDDLDVGAYYTYGVQLDQNPALFQILQFSSHAAGAWGDYKLTSRRGVKPLLGVERRTTQNDDVLWVTAFELSGYARW